MVKESFRSRSEHGNGVLCVSSWAVSYRKEVGSRMVDIGLIRRKSGFKLLGLCLSCLGRSFSSCVGTFKEDALNRVFPA